MRLRIPQEPDERRLDGLTSRTHPDQRLALPEPRRADLFEAFMRLRVDRVEIGGNVVIGKISHRIVRLGAS